MANAPKGGENLPGSKALGLICFPSGGGMRKLWLSRKAVVKIRVTLVGFFRLQAVG